MASPSILIVMTDGQRRDALGCMGRGRCADRWVRLARCARRPDPARPGGHRLSRRETRAGFVGSAAGRGRGGRRGGRKPADRLQYGAPPPELTPYDFPDESGRVWRRLLASQHMHVLVDQRPQAEKYFYDKAQVGQPSPRTPRGPPGICGRIPSSCGPSIPAEARTSAHRAG